MQTLVTNALQWIVYPEEPLTTKQLLQASAIREGDANFDSSGMTTVDELLHWCSSLVQRSSTGDNLELTPYTVKDFLLAISAESEPHFKQYLLIPNHAMLAMQSIDFLNVQEF